MMWVARLGIDRGIQSIKPPSQSRTYVLCVATSSRLSAMIRYARCRSRDDAPLLAFCSTQPVILNDIITIQSTRSIAADSGVGHRLDRIRAWTRRCIMPSCPHLFAET